MDVCTYGSVCVCARGGCAHEIIAWPCSLNRQHMLGGTNEDPSGISIPAYYFSQGQSVLWVPICLSVSHRIWAVICRDPGGSLYSKTPPPLGPEVLPLAFLNLGWALPSRDSLLKVQILLEGGTQSQKDGVLYDEFPSYFYRQGRKAMCRWCFWGHLASTWQSAGSSVIAYLNHRAPPSQCALKAFTTGFFT